MIVEQVSGSAWAECPNGVESALIAGFLPDADHIELAFLPKHLGSYQRVVAINLRRSHENEPSCHIILC